MLNFSHQTPKHYLCTNIISYWMKTYDLCGASQIIHLQNAKRFHFITSFHYDGTKESWCNKTMAAGMFVLPLDQANNKGYIKVLFVALPSQRACNMESIAKSWCQHMSDQKHTFLIMKTKWNFGEKNHVYILFMTVPTDDPALLCAKPSAVTVMTKFKCCVFWRPRRCFTTHFNDVIMSTMASQITGTDQRKRQSSGSLAFVRGIHWWPVNSPHKRPVTRKMFHLMTSSCVNL